MDILKDLGIGVSVGVPLADKQTLIDNYNNAIVSMPNKLGYQVTYSNPVVCDRTDVTVVNSAYDTSGNGGKKSVRLSNGWLVCAALSSDYLKIFYYKSIDNGATWSQMYYIDTTGASPTVLLKGFSLASVGTKTYTLINGVFNTSTYFIKNYIFDATIITNTNGFSAFWNLTNIDVDVNGSQSNIQPNCSLIIDTTGSELHACWSSKNSTYAYSFNIRYCKGIINSDEYFEGC